MGVGVGWCVGRGRWDTLGAAELKKHALDGVVCILSTPTVLERQF